MSYTKIPHFVFEGAEPRIIKWEPPLNVRGLATGRPKKTKTKHAVTNIEGRFPLYGDSASGAQRPSKILLSISV